MKPSLDGLSDLLLDDKSVDACTKMKGGLMVAGLAGGGQLDELVLVTVHHHTKSSDVSVRSVRGMHLIQTGFTWSDSGGWPREVHLWQNGW